MQYCFTLFLCTIRCFIMEQKLTWVFGHTWATCSRCCCSSRLSSCQIVFCFFFHPPEHVSLYVVCGFDVKLLLGRIIFDFWSQWKLYPCVNLYPALHIPTRCAFSVFHLFANRHILPMSLLLQWFFSDHLLLLHFLFFCYPALLWSYPSLLPSVLS